MVTFLHSHSLYAHSFYLFVTNCLNPFFSAFCVSFSLPLRRQPDYKVLRCYRKSRSEPGDFSLASGSRPSKGQMDAKVLHDLRPRTEGGYNQDEMQQWERSSRRCWLPLAYTHRDFVFPVLVKPSSLWQNLQNLYSRFMKTKELGGLMGIKTTDTHAECSHQPLYVCVRKAGSDWGRNSADLYATQRKCTGLRGFCASIPLDYNLTGTRVAWDMCSSLWLWA